MARPRQDISNEIGKQISGTHLILVGEDGRNAYGSRMVTTECLLCGKRARQRHSNLRAARVKSCGCLKVVQYKKFQTEKAARINKETQEAIYTACITGKIDGKLITSRTRQSIAKHFQLQDVALVDFVYRMVDERIKAIPPHRLLDIYTAAQKASNKLSDLAAQNDLPPVAVSTAISYINGLMLEETAWEKEQGRLLLESRRRQETLPFLSPLSYEAIRCAMKRALSRASESYDGVLRADSLRNGPSDYGWHFHDVDEEGSRDLNTYPVWMRFTVLQFRALCLRSYEERKQRRETRLAQLRKAAAEHSMSLSDYQAMERARDKERKLAAQRRAALKSSQEAENNSSAGQSTSGIVFNDEDGSEGVILGDHWGAQFSAEQGADYELVPAA